MPFDRRRYPDDWEDIRARILARAENRCERCGIPNHALGYRDKAGKFWTDEEIDRMVNGDTLDYPPMRRIRIVLTIAHVHDPDPMNCDESNLEALCQQCHNRHDAPMRAKNAAKTRRARAGQTEMEL
jgi:5-methylcytosine-specific restriction endonuclease McrA